MGEEKRHGFSLEVCDILFQLLGVISSKAVDHHRLWELGIRKKKRKKKMKTNEDDV